MSLSLFAAVHVLGSLWFAAGDTPGGWVIEEGLHEMQLTRQYTRSMDSRLLGLLRKMLILMLHSHYAVLSFLLIVIMVVVSNYDFI